MDGFPGCSSRIGVSSMTPVSIGNDAGDGDEHWQGVSKDTRERQLHFFKFLTEFNILPFVLFLFHLLELINRAPPHFFIGFVVRLLNVCCPPRTTVVHLISGFEIICPLMHVVCCWTSCVCA